ncbi:MAG: branched-chain amino acid ABC transporter permease [Thermoleophilia bacterium]|nr:branched-chain amino acid ABC transporter permease [Thermoleophilia bacterium]
MVKWIQLLVTGVTMGSIYALIALGYVTIYRTSRIVNMAQGAFVMFGAFFTYSFLSELGLPYWLSAILGIIGVAVVGVLMYLIVLRPLVKVSLVSIILATMALSILFENLALVRWGGYGHTVPAFTGDQVINVGGVNVFRQSLWVIGLMILVLIGLYALTNFTRVGKQMTATANDPAAASLSGVNTGRMIILAFAISAAIGALGGIAVTPISQTSYLSGGIYALSGFVAAILGGWGSSSGAVVGGLALGIIQSLVTGVLPAGYQDAIAYAVLILVLYFRPSGLLGIRSSEGEA